MTYSENDSSGRVFSGILHAYAAFDWGEEVNFESARQVVAAELLALPRRTRTPTSIAYQAPPLRFGIMPISLTLPGVGQITVPADVTLFDFGAVSVAMHIPFQLSAAALTRLAGSLWDKTLCVLPARLAVEPLFQRLQSAIVNPQWMDLSEEYFVFQILPKEGDPAPEQLLADHAGWLAGLVRLEAEPLSSGEIAEALRLHLSYSPSDLLVADWAAAVALDRNCDEILETIAFANLQLLEFQHIDQRLDTRLKTAYGLIHQLARSWLPIWQTHTRPLRDLGELNVEVNGMLERTNSALTLVGDPYLARVYHLVSARFHLEEWGANIRRSIAVLQEIYEVVANQAATHRTQVLEVTVIVLILVEIVLAIWRH